MQCDIVLPAVLSQYAIANVGMATAVPAVSRGVANMWAVFGLMMLDGAVPPACTYMRVQACALRSVMVYVRRQRDVVEMEK